MDSKNDEDNITNNNNDAASEELKCQLLELQLLSNCLDEFQKQREEEEEDWNDQSTDGTDMKEQACCIWSNYNLNKRPSNKA